MAVVFLFPIKPNSTLETDGSKLADNDVVFIKQTIPNACGTIALLHALTNNSQIVQENSDLVFDLIKLKESDRSQFLEESKTLKEIHKSFATQGQTNGEALESDLHFVCFIEKNGKLYELDGRRSGPKEVCQIQNSLLHDACMNIKQIMSQDPNELNFTTLALVKE